MPSIVLYAVDINVLTQNPGSQEISLSEEK